MVAASSILFGIVPVFVKEASDRGAEVLPLTIFRLLVMVLLAAGGTALRRISFQVTPRQLAQLAVFGTAGFGLTNLLNIPTKALAPCICCFPVPTFWWRWAQPPSATLSIPFWSW